MLKACEAVKHNMAQSTVPVEDTLSLLAIGGWSDKKHQELCQVNQCVRCKWIRYRETWQKALPWLDVTWQLQIGALGARSAGNARIRLLMSWENTMSPSTTLPDSR